MQIHELLEARARVWEQTKAHLDTVEAEGRADSAEAKETYDRLHADMRSLDEQIKDAVDLDRRNKAADELRAKYAPKPETQAARPSDADVLRKMANGEIRAFEFTAESRDLVKGTNSAGGYTVPTSFYAQLQEHMLYNSAMRQTNAQILRTASGENLQVPKTTTHPTAAIITEGSTITESDAAFGQLTLGAYKYAFSTQISSELEQDSAIDLAAYLARRAGEALGNASGAHFVTGTGSSQPQGIVPVASAGVTGGTGVTGAFTADNLIDLYYSVYPAYRNRGTWMLNDTALAALKKLKDGNGRYIFEPNSALDNAPLFTGGVLMGRPVVSDPNMASPAVNAKSVLFGDFSTYMIREVNGVRAERSVDFAFQSDLVTWRFILRADGNLVDRTGAVKYFVGAAS